jgi:hypothetical protein
MLTNEGTTSEAHAQAVQRAHDRLLQRLEWLGVEMVDGPEIIVSAPGSIVKLHHGQAVECYWWGYERIYTEKPLGFRDLMRRIAGVVEAAKKGQWAALGPFGRELLRSWLMQGRPDWEAMDFSEWEEAPVLEAGRTRAELADEGWY